MSVLQKILAFFRPRKVALVRIVAAFCVLGLLLNFVPELASSLPSLADDEVSVVAQAPLPIPAGAIVVGEVKSDAVNSGAECDIDGLDTPADNNCDLGDAITFANTNPGGDIIVFRSTLTTIEVSLNTPPITENLIVNGTMPSSGKIVLKDDNPGS